jgi:CRP/FNR family transcriptional regulator
MSEGEPAMGLCILLRGRVKMSRRTPSGSRALLALFGPGDLFGAVSALSGQEANATMVALERTELLEIPQQALRSLLSSRPDLLGELLPLLSQQLVECRNCLVEAVSSRVEVRFAHLFLKLGERVGRQEDGGTFVPVALSRQDLADMTGTTLESSIRVMSRWGKGGVVETVDEGFIVRDRESLERLVGG